jgi:glycosyltransferase involved in cell wall biosynthesis
MIRVSVIVPTTCEAGRASSLRRAIDSVRAQQGVCLELIVVVNGRRFEPSLLEALRHDSSLRVHYVETPSPSVACRTGRALASGEFFAFLDDDDEYLPEALAVRAKAMESEPSVDVVVTNGYSGRDGNLHLTRTAKIASDPMTAMLEQNWLASCGGMFRSSSCGDVLFADLPNYLEWTLLAFRLLLAGKRVKFIDRPTYRINDTPSSASKSREYDLAAVDVLGELLSLDVPATIRRRLRHQLLAARHHLSVKRLEEGDRRAAWRLHLQSLAGLPGLRYLSYTRRLLF